MNVADCTSLDDKLEKLYAVRNAPNLPLGVVLRWRLCSGFAHGRPWAYLGSLHREEVDSGSDIRNVKLISDLGRTLYPALASVQLLERFLRLYSARAETGLA